QYFPVNTRASNPGPAIPRSIGRDGAGASTIQSHFVQAFFTRSEKLRREVELAEALLKQREQDSDRYSGREDDPQVPRQLRQSRHRRPLPAHLPREIHRLEPEESCCPECGGELDYLGEVSAEQLELVSSALKVIRTERVKKACTKCDCIVEAPAPSRPIERGIAGPGLLARVLTGKY
ncbi:IS66 family transposase zinc-finger binding domain-containing protein, partial [Escherichia coli]|uniref:IS66 family transposase zinc-finger binding domain-containing protein n=1 Tax=Escherichia coli TaxID=562 RepID=UPI003EE36E2C